MTGNELKERIKESGMTHEQVANLLNVSRSTIHRAIESEEVPRDLAIAFLESTIETAYEKLKDSAEDMLKLLNGVIYAKGLK